MKRVFNSGKLDKDNVQLISLLRILGSLEYCIAAMKWYAGEEAERTELPAHESILSLAINIASTAESLHKFDWFVEKGIITFSLKWSKQTTKAWDFLQSEDVKNLKINHLKLIRDKSAFHIDPEPIKAFIVENHYINEKIILWETDENGKMGHSPFASQIVANQLMKSTFENRETAKLTSKVFGALRDVVLASLDEILNVESEV